MKSAEELRAEARQLREAAEKIADRADAEEPPAKMTHNF
jgi:hypothetical protein